MKNSKLLLLLLIGMTSNSIMFCQKTIDSLKEETTKPIFYDKLSPDESWELHKINCRKKLKAKGLTVDEIEKEIASYEKQKDHFLENLMAERKNTARRRVEAEMRRDEAVIQRRKEEKRKDEAKIRRQQGVRSQDR